MVIQYGAVGATLWRVNVCGEILSTNGGGTRSVGVLVRSTFSIVGKNKHSRQIEDTLEGLAHPYITAHL